MELTEEAFLEEAKALYAQMKKELTSSTIDFYEYESRLDKLNTEFSRKLLALSLSDTNVPSSQKKKYKRGSGKSN